jgi:hypothetical protein
LLSYFFDGVSATLPQYEVDRIVGGILSRVQKVQKVDDLDEAS